jgi:hypothetical protein
MIILLCGYKGSGKDTCANYICKKYKFVHHKISLPLKEGLQKIFDFSDEQIEGSLKDEVDPNWLITPREAMVYLGTEIFQYHIQNKLPNIGRNFWIQQLERKLVDNKNSHIIISDLRFWHELTYLKQHVHKDDIIVVKIYNPNIQIYQKDADQSETEHLNFPIDYIIENTADENYFTNIDLVLSSLCK